MSMNTRDKPIRLPALDGVIMTEAEIIEWKSLELAKLMGWEINPYHLIGGVPVTSTLFMEMLRPYSSSIDGLAQSMAILLEFKEVICEFVIPDGDCATLDSRYSDKDVTQSNLMDEVLRMKGVDIDE